MKSKPAGLPKRRSNLLLNFSEFGERKYFNPNYALGMHSLPRGLTNTDGTVSIVKVKP